MQLGTTILAIMLSLLFAFNISAGERRQKHLKKSFEKTYQNRGT